MSIRKRVEFLMTDQGENSNGQARARLRNALIPRGGIGRSKRSQCETEEWPPWPRHDASNRRQQRRNRKNASPVSRRILRNVSGNLKPKSRKPSALSNRIACGT